MEKTKKDISVTERYITGWRLHTISFVINICLFIAQMESTITSTSIITITDDLGGYIKSSWILTAYWLTACAFQIIWAKLSDILGRKVCLLSALLLFTTFSGACGGSQTVFQLIMFRWVQGIGGCGVLAIGQLVFFDLVPPHKYPVYIGLVTAVIAGSLISGPLVGGGVTLHGNWRWVFLFNVPVGTLSMLILGWLFPLKLWNECAEQQRTAEVPSPPIFKRLDILGTVLLLGSCLLLTTGLQQAAAGYAFSSAFVLPLLVCSGPFIVAFFTWQWYITTRRSYPEPVFPWRFCQHRTRLGMITNSCLSGGVLSICVFQIPQRWMTVNGLSPFSAAARLLAFGAFVPAASSVTAAIMSRFRVRPCVIMAIGCTLQLLGTIFLSRASSEPHIHPSQYGLQVLIGIGVGSTISGIVIQLPYAMEKQDLAVATASMSQFRILGGLISVAAVTSIAARRLRSQLEHIVPPELLGMILERTDTLRLLPEDTLPKARLEFGNSLNLQMKFAIGLSAAQILVTAAIWTREEFNVRNNATQSVSKDQNDESKEKHEDAN